MIRIKNFKTTSLCIFFLLFHVWGSVAQQDRSKIQITDLLAIKTISDLQVSPSGRELLFSIKSIVDDPDRKGEYAYKSQIWKSSTSEPHRLEPFTELDKSASQGRFSPDGKQLLFTRQVKGNSQLFILPLAGGEAQQITDFKYGASAGQWSPDGKSILFSSSVSAENISADPLLQDVGGSLPNWSFEKPGIATESVYAQLQEKSDPNGSINQIRAYLDQNVKDKKVKVINKIQFQTESFTTGELRFNHYYRISLDDPKQVIPVGNGFKSYANASFWSNQEVILNIRGEGLQHPDRELSSAIYLVDLESLTQKSLFAQADVQLNLAAVHAASGQIAFLKNSYNTLTIPELYLWNGHGEPLLIPYDRGKDNVSFDTEGKQLYFTSASHGGQILNRLTISNRKIEQLSSVDEGISDYVVLKQHIIQVKTTNSQPSALFQTDLQGQKSQLWADFNQSWLASKAVAPIEKFTLKNDIGLDIEYWLIKPSDFDPSKKYPLLVEIHGGPASMFGPSDGSMWLEYQYFAAQGYLVLYSNPRGSAGYGHEFLKANYQDWGKGPASDVLAGLDEISKNNFVDTSNLFVTGGSYGGYLTSWIVSTDQRFKAASSQRGVYDLTTFFGEGNVWPMVKRYFGGFPWEPGIAEQLQAASVLDIAHQIQTPLLIFHGEQDLRTGIAQSERLYKTLKVLNRPVEYVRHPNANHEITRSGDNRQRIDQLLRTYEFFERFRKPTE